jgi:hypothetical protein
LKAKTKKRIVRESEKREENFHVQVKPGKFSTKPPSSECEREQQQQPHNTAVCVAGIMLDIFIHNVLSFFMDMIHESYLQLKNISFAQQPPTSTPH